MKTALKITEARQPLQDSGKNHQTPTLEWSINAQHCSFHVHVRPDQWSSQFNWKVKNILELAMQEGSKVSPSD
jgi:hypothetical protein